MLVSSLVGLVATPANAVDTPIGFGWGYNTAGQLAAEPAKALVPAQIRLGDIPVGAVVTQVSTGGYSTCLIADGLAYCAGDNGAGQLGTGNLTPKSTPTAVDTSGVLAGKTIAEIVASNQHTCVRTTELTDNIYCWGGNSYGQLGIGNFNDQSSPVSASNGALVGKKVIDIDTVGYSTCAVTDEPTSNVYCWGLNQNGLLGRGGTAGDTSLPAAVYSAGALSGLTVEKVFGGITHNCVVTTELTDNAYCWGRNIYAEMGVGPGSTTNNEPLHLTVGDIAGKRLTDMTSGQIHGCAIDTTGKLYCWGGNYNGSVGNNSSSQVNLPTDISAQGSIAGKTMIKVKATFNQTCAMDSAGGWHCWGQQGAFFGSGTDSYNDSLVPEAATALPVGVTFSSFTFESYSVCALSDAGVVWCWGDNSGGQLMSGGAGQFFEPHAMVNSMLASGKRYSDISTANATTCAIADGVAYCAGENTDGHLGVGDDLPRSTVVAVDATGVLNGKTLVDVATSDYNTCVLDTAGQAYCWGYNYYGQVGNATTNTELSPVSVDMTGMNGEVFTEIQAGQDFICGVSDVGNVWCWGYNGDGALGDGTYTNRSVPTQIDRTNAGSIVFTHLAVDDNAACAWSAAGDAYCWGYHPIRIGKPDYNYYEVPFDARSGVLAGKTVTEIGFGYEAVCAVADGLLYCSGAGYYGQMGDGTGNDAPDWIPVDMTGPINGKTIIQLTGGNDFDAGFICALDDAGQTYCWGSNNYGQLGNGDADQRNTPTPVNQNGAKFASIDGGVGTMVATVLIPKYTVTIATGGTGSGTVSQSTIELEEGAAFSSTASATGSSTFSGWTCTPNSYDTTSATLSFTVTEDVSCTASFALPQYAVTIATAGTGSGSVSQTTQTLDSGSTFTSVATANAGSTFAGWTCTPNTYNTTNATLTFTVSEAVSCTATFNLAASGQTVTSIAPNHSKLSGGVKVTVTGTGFTSRTKVYVAGKEVKIKSRTGSTKFTFDTPSSKRTGWVSVRVVTGSASTTVDQGIYYDPDKKKRD